MFIDLKYIDNVVFLKDSVNELLTNIKNYPIIDIDYIEQSEMDDKSLAHDNQTIWNYYTDGTPCIKITYGDENTKKGNIIYAKDFLKAKNLGKKEINKLINESADLLELKNKWQKVYEANKKVYDARYALLELVSNLTFETSFSNMENIVDSLIALKTDGYSVLFEEFWNDMLKLSLPEATAQTPNPPATIVRQDVSILGNLENDSPDPPIIITFPVFNTTGKMDLLSYLNSEIQQYSIDAESDTYDAFEAVKQDVNNYPDYTILLTGNFINTNEQTNNIDYYNIYRQDPQTIYEYLKNFLVFVVNSAKIKRDNAKTIRDYYASLTVGIEDKILRLNNMIANCDECIEAVADGSYIINDESSNIEEINHNVETFLTKVNNGSTTITKDPGLYQIGKLSEFLQGIDYYHLKGDNFKINGNIISSYYSTDLINAFEIDSNNAPPKYVPILVMDVGNNEEALIPLYNPNLNYYYLVDSEHLEYEKYTYTNNEEWVEAVQSGNLYTERIYYIYYANTSDCDVLAQETSGDDKLLTGIKYVKVGSNIKFIDSLTGNTITPTTASYLDLNNGSFRVTINSDTYEVPIKGFENSNTDDLVINTNLIPDNMSRYIPVEEEDEYNANLVYYILENNLYIRYTGDETQWENDKENLYIKISDINLGSENNLFDNGYFTNLYSDNLYSDNGYFNEININGILIGGTGGSGDTGKFLRGDGLWSNLLTGELNISDTGKITVNNTLEAERYTEIIYTAVDTNILISNNILQEIQEGYYTIANNGIGNVDNDGTLYYLSPAVSSVDFGTMVTILGDTAGGTNTIEITSGRLLPDNTSLLNYLNSYGINVSPTVTTTSYLFTSDQANNYYIFDNGAYVQCLQGLYYLNNTFYTSEGATNDPAAGLGDNNAIVEGSITTLGGISARKSIKGYKIYAAVFNDYAECRATTIAGPGYVVIDQDNGTMIPSTKRLLPGALVISDTYGHLVGEMPGIETPIAVAGRVLVYTYQPRENYHAGMAVCSAPGGTIDIMTREEIRDYPDCIIGIVSEIPLYEKWGSELVNVNGRIWIKVR